MARRAMGLHMALELAGLRTGMGTERTLERLFARVGAAMHNQVTLKSETFATKLAGSEFPRWQYVLFHTRLSAWGRGFGGGG